MGEEKQNLINRVNEFYKKYPTIGSEDYAQRRAWKIEALRNYYNFIEKENLSTNPPSGLK